MPQPSTPSPAPQNDLRDKIVLLTGGANGIGAATVAALAAAGATVHFGDVDTRRGRALARRLGAGVAFHRVDLTEERQVQAWIAAVGQRHGRVDVLVNNAASDPRIPLAQQTTRAWDDLFARNLRAMMYTCREAAPWFPATGGSIINFGSVTFHEGPANMGAYVATKGGIIGFTRSLARELGPRRIRVNALCPGWIMTERQLRMYVTPAVKRRIRRGQCIPDLLQPEEIADVVLFLASDASRAITGQSLVADRGWYHH